MTLRSARRQLDSGPRRAYAGGISAVIAAACYSSFLLSPWTHAAASAGNGFISELEDPGHPFSWLYRSSDVIAGLGVLYAAWMMGRVMAGCRRAGAGLVLLALTGVSSLLDAATSMPCDPDASAQCAQHEHTAGGLIGQLLVLHTDSGLLGFLSSAAGAAVLGAALAGRWRSWGRLQLALGICIAGCGLADLVLLLTGGSIGTTERARVLLTSGWFLAVGMFLLCEGRYAAHDDSRPLVPHDLWPSGRPGSRTRLTRGGVGDHHAIMAGVEEVEVVVAHNERATLRVGDVFLKIDADQTRTDVEVTAMAMAPVPTPEVLWRKPPVLALAALPGTALGRLGEPSAASPAAWAAAGAAARRLHDAPLPPWPGQSRGEIASHLDGECEWLITNGVLPADMVTRNRQVAEAALRPWTPVFTHGDLQITHVFVDGDEITGVIDWSEAGQGDALYDLASLTLGHEEHLGDVIAGYGTDVDLDVIRAWWSLRSLRAARWLIEHGFDPSSPGCEFAVLRSRL